MTTSTELAVRAASLPEKIDYAERLAFAGLLPDVYREQPANVLYAIEYGETLGISTMAAINGVNVIKGKPTASAGLIGALVRRAGHKLRIGYDAETMTGWAEIVRADDPDFTFRSEWVLERAVEAELCQVRDGRPFAVDSKGNSLPWKKFYPSMVKARATTEVARDACEEVLFGLHYTPEELGAAVDEDGAVVERRAERASRSVPIDDEWTRPAPAVEAVEVEDAELVDETPAPPAPGISDEQMKKLHVELKERGLTRREQGLAAISRILGPDVAIGSTKDLTKAQASTVINALVTGEIPAPAPAESATSGLYAEVLAKQIGVARDSDALADIGEEIWRSKDEGTLTEGEAQRLIDLSMARESELSKMVGAAS